jgi:TetR/AcrR family transcriptional regulator
MARPRAATYEAHRDKILTSAAQLFAVKGYTAASMADIARDSGVSKASLYHYFGDKQSILEEIAMSHVQRLEALVASVEAEAPNPPRRLRLLLERFMQAYTGAQHAHRVLTEDVKFLDASARSRVVAAQRRVVDAFGHAIGALRSDLPQDMHKPMAMLLFGMINWTYIWLKPGGPWGHDDLAPLVTDLFLGGLPAVEPTHRTLPSAVTS